MTTMAIHANRVSCTKAEPGMMHFKLLAVTVALFSLCMIGVGSELEQLAVAQIKRAEMGPHMTYEVVENSEQKLGIIRDRFLMFLIGCGAFGGAITCICLRMAYAMVKNITLPSALLGAYFTVSFLSSLFCAPAIMKRWSNESPEDCFGGSFLMAVAAWVFWECISIAGDRIKKATTERGISGARDEILGRSTQPSQTTTKQE